MFNKGPQVGHCLSLSVHGTMLYQLCFWDILADNVLKSLPDSTEDLSIWTAKKNKHMKCFFCKTSLNHIWRYDSNWISTHASSSGAMAAHIGFKESFASLAVRHNGNVKSQRWKCRARCNEIPSRCSSDCLHEDSTNRTSY